MGVTPTAAKKNLLRKVAKISYQTKTYMLNKKNRSRSLKKKIELTKFTTFTMASPYHIISLSQDLKLLKYKLN